jgi:hypothetical protein
MARFVAFGGAVLIAGGLAVGSISCAGVAMAKPTCSGSIDPGSAHQPFPTDKGPSNSAFCEDADDTSKTGMAEIGQAGSFTIASPAIVDAPQKTT